jgi:hypothetical protein
MAAPSSPAQPAPEKLGAGDLVERWGQLTLEANLALERGEDFKARQSYSEALAVAEQLMVAAARSHDARAARFAPSLYGISCNDIIALARQQDDGLTAGIFLCKLAGGYLSVMESAEAPVALRARCLLHSRVASATLCAYFEERGMWDAAQTYSTRANAAFFSVHAAEQAALALPNRAREASLLLLEPSLLLFDPNLLLESMLAPEARVPRAEPSSPPEPRLMLPEPSLPPEPRLPSESNLLPEPPLQLPEPSLSPEPRLLLPEPSLPPEPRSTSESNAPSPRIPRPVRPVASVIPVEPAASSVAPASASFELPSASSVAPPQRSATLRLPTLDRPPPALEPPVPPSAPRGSAALGEAGWAPPSMPWDEPESAAPGEGAWAPPSASWDEPLPELRPSLWSDPHPALDLSPPEPPPRRTWGARLLDWTARAFRRSPRSTLPSLGSRSA